MIDDYTRDLYRYNEILDKILLAIMNEDLLSLAQLLKDINVTNV
jgi:hypothetical protein